MKSKRQMNRKVNKNYILAYRREVRGRNSRFGSLPHGDHGFKKSRPRKTSYDMATCIYAVGIGTDDFKSSQSKLPQDNRSCKGAAVAGNPLSLRFGILTEMEAHARPDFRHCNLRLYTKILYKKM
jgi:hypothetical protein